MKYTFKGIIKSLPVKKNSNSSWWVKLWVRRISFLFTYLFINLGFSSNAVTAVSILVTLAGCVCFAISTNGCVIAAVILINLWLILDCVDGNIARCKQQKKRYGEFIDAMGGYFTVAFVYLAMGICTFHRGGVLLPENCEWILIGGAVSSVCDILARLIYTNYCVFNQTDGVSEEKAQQENKRSINYLRKRVSKELGLSGMFMPAIIIAAIFNAYDIVTLFYLAFNGFALLSTAVIYFYKANKHDSKNA